MSSIARLCFIIRGIKHNAFNSGLRCVIIIIIVLLFY